MADFESRIDVNINTSSAISSIKALQSKLADLQRQISNNSTVNSASAKNFQRNLIADINASGKYVARMQQIRSTTEQFTYALERNKLSMGQYFRYAASTSKTFGSKFTTEFKTIEKVARERVKSLQTQYIAMGRDANGALQSIAVRPLKLDLNSLATQQAINIQKQQIFNQLLKQGSTNLLNFGKNTQWAGRQLMVGFTIPLSIFGAQASKAFMSVEEQAIKFRRVYGELFTPPAEADQMIDSLKELSKEFTQYGVSLEDTLSLAGDVAAMGKTGADLLAQVEQATKLSVLGGVDQAKALESTISITNAFGIAAEDLASKIDFLNAVENQTVLSIDDLTTAIPKAGPVIKQLGGSVEDLAYFMTAMKEGGVNASEGANALKSGLARMINPTKAATEFLAQFNININKIVEGNAGDIKAAVIELSDALDTLDPLSKARAIEELFGRFQFARISTLFQNISAEGTQASRVLDLTTASARELAELSSKELGNVSESTTFKFKKTLEEFQVAIAPIGEQFLKAVTPAIEFVTKILQKFDEMGDGAKNFVVVLTAVLGAVAPIALMTFGLVANGVANLIKGFAAVRNLFIKTGQDSTILGGQMEYLTQEQLQAGAVASSLEQSHQRLTQQFTVEKTALDALINSYNRAITAGSSLANLRGIPSTLGNPQRFAEGGIVRGPGTGTSDSILAMLSNGEAVIPADVVARNPRIIEQLVSGNIPGYASGSKKISAYGGSTTMMSGGGVPFALGNSASSKLGMSSEFFGSSDFTKMFSAGAVGAAFRADNPGARMNADGLMPYLEEAEDDLQAIVETLRKSEQSLRDAGTNIESFDQITANAKKDLEKIFDRMKAKGGRAASTANAVQREMLDPTAESIKGSKLSETRARAVKYNPATGRTTETVFRMTGTAGQTAANRAAMALYPQEAQRLQAAGGSFAHLNEKRLGGGSLPIRGGIMGMKDSQLKRDMIARLEGSSRKYGSEYPEGKLVNRAEVKKAAAEKAKIYQDEMDKNLKDPYVESRDRQSPHRLAKKDGEDDARAYSEGYAKGQKKSGSRRVQGQMVNGQMVYSNPNKKTGPRRVTSAPQTASRDEALRRQSEARAAQAQQAQIASSQRLTRVSNGAMYALTTLSGMAAMAGGQIGQVGAVMFQVTAGMTALNAVMGMFSEKTLVQIALDRIKAATTAMRTYSEAAATAGTNVFTAALGRASVGLLAFLGGGVGLGILAATAAIAGLVAAVIYYNKQQEEARKKIEALGIGAEFARGKMAEFANAMAGTNFQGPRTGTSTEKGSPSQAVLDAQAKFAADESVLTTFQEQIDQLALVGDAQIKGIVDQLALTLASYGMEAVDIEGLIRALLEKAGKADIEVDFDNVSFVSTSSSLRKSSKNLADQIQKAYDKIPGQQTLMISGTEVATDQGMTEEERRAQALNETEAERAELVANTAVGLLAVNTALENNQISAARAAAQSDAFIGTLSGLDDGMLKEMLPDLAKELGLDNPDLYSGIDNVDAALRAMQAQALGMDVEPSLVKFLSSDASSGEEMRAKAMGQKSFNKEFDKYLKSKEQEQKIEEENAIREAAVAELGDLLTAVEEAEAKKKAYNELVESGKEAAEAARIVGDSMLYEAYTSAVSADAINGTTKATDDFWAALQRLDAAKLPDLKSGGSETTPYQDAIESLKSQQSELRNTTAAYTRLRKAGYDIATSASLASDSTLALALATTKVGTDKYKELLRLIKDIDKATKESALNDLIRDRKQDIQLKSQFLKIAPIIQSLGVDMQDVMSILDDPDTAQAFIDDLKDGELNSKNLLNYIKQIKQIKKIEVDIELMTDEGKWAKVDSAFGDVTKYFEAQKASIDAKYRNEIEAQEKIIENAQEKVDEYNQTIYENEYQLEGIQAQEDVINEKYDTRIKALDQILAVNKLIQAQQKGNLAVADAITQGDIAAAARAVEQARIDVASARAEDMKSKLEAAKEKELASVRSADGRTRLELETQIKDIKKQISDIEHDTIKPAEKVRDASIATRDAEKDSLNFLGLNEQAWKDVETATNKARVEAEAYKKAIEDAMKLLPGLTDGSVTMPDKYTGDSGGGGNANQARIDELNRLRQISREKYQNSTDEAYKKRLWDINVKRGKEIKELGGTPMAMGGLVKYLAAGGFARGTDTVPAMLTPGEFVVRRQAVRNFGTDRLKAINSGTYGADSVYNYNLSVNVKSDANPDEIASAVMMKIKGIESQRIRGGRF